MPQETKLEKVKRLRDVPKGQETVVGLIQMADNQDPRVEAVKRIKSMMQPTPQPPIQAPGQISDHPYVQAEMIEQEAQPRDIRPQGFKENFIAGVQGAFHPQGYQGMMLQEGHLERQRVQDMLEKAKALKQQGFQQQQLYQQGQNQQLNREAQQEQYRRVNAMDEEQLKLEKAKFHWERDPKNPANQATPRNIDPNSPEGIAARLDFENRRPKPPTAQTASEPLVSIVGPDGKPVLVPRRDAAGKTPATTREQGRQVMSSDANRIADLDTSLNDLVTLRNTVLPTDPATGQPSEFKSTGTAAKVGAMLPNFVTEATGLGADAKSRQAVIDRVKQVIGKALEGGVLRKEDEYKYEKILPTIYDPPEVVKTKLDGLETAIKQRRETTLDALEDAAYDVSRFRIRGQGGQPPTDTEAPPQFSIGPDEVLMHGPNGTPVAVHRDDVADALKQGYTRQR